MGERGAGSGGRAVTATGRRSGERDGEGGTVEVGVFWGELGRCADPRELLERARAYASVRGLAVQLFDARAVASEDHLRSAALHALRARERGVGRALGLDMELLLYASGRRQIRDAIAVVGVGPGTRTVAALLVGPGARGSGAGLLRAIGASRASSRAVGGRRALARLGLAGRNPDAALEMVALLDVEKQ